MYYYLYKITNLLNNRFYIGVHKSKKPNDNYYGSGKLIRQAIKKYGKENFKKEILEYFDNEEEMYTREKEIVDMDFINLESTYNLKCGGQCFLWENLEELRSKQSRKMSEMNKKNWKDEAYQEKMKILVGNAARKNWESNERRRENQSKLMKQQSSNYWKDESYRKHISQCVSDYMKDRWKKLSEEDKEKQSELTHNQFIGTKHIHNDELKKSTVVKKELLDEYLSSGWELGRKKYTQ